MPDVVVIGAGVIGLSCASRLQQAGHSVTIIAKDFPVPFETSDPRTHINYTSLWGGAHNRWVLPTNDAETREHEMARTTYRHMQSTLAEYPDSGITFMPGIEYLEAPSAVCQNLTEQKAKELGMEEFSFIPDGELPKNVKLGYRYKTWCVNPMVYCAFIMRQFTFNGGKIKKLDLQNPQEVFSFPENKDVQLVVNCSGTGFGDPAFFPTRGQTCLVANECNATVTRQNADGSWTFCVPRNFHGGTVIGGTKEPDNWDPEPSSEVRKILLDKFAATHPAIVDHGGPENFRVLRDIVGRRPTRKGGLRLEAEQVSIPGKKDSRVVVHAYGLGGRGFELSWGVAERVLQLVEEQLSDSDRTYKYPPPSRL